MWLRFFALLVFTGITAVAGWQRHVAGTTGFFTDSPPAHPLAYFQVDPCLRPDTDRLGNVIDCTQWGTTPAELENRNKTEIDLVEVGMIGVFTIYDLSYKRTGTSVLDPDLRSVLIKTGADQYREIDVVVRRNYFWTGLALNSEIVTLNGESILIAKSHDGGNDNNIFQERYMFRQSGWETPDFRAIGNAVRKLMPANMSFRASEEDFASMTYTAYTYRSDLPGPPVSVKERGRIIVKYRFVNGHAVVTSARYEPYSLE
jgi:hypothetical protein